MNKIHDLVLAGIVMWWLSLFPHSRKGSGFEAVGWELFWSLHVLLKPVWVCPLLLHNPEIQVRLIGDC